MRIFSTSDDNIYAVTSRFSLAPCNLSRHLLCNNATQSCLLNLARHSESPTVENASADSKSAAEKNLL